MTILNDQELDNKITTFKTRRMNEVFPELRYQSEMHTEQSTDRRTISQWLHDMVAPTRSAQL